MNDPIPTPLEQILLRASSVLFPAKPPHRIDVNARDCDGDTPLHKAVMWRDCNAVSLLLQAGAAIDAQGDMGCTPLYLAVLQNDADIARLLLERGASTEISSELGGSPKSIVLKRGSPELRKVFRRRVMLRPSTPLPRSGGSRRR